MQAGNKGSAVPRPTEFLKDRIGQVERVLRVGRKFVRESLPAALAPEVAQARSKLVPAMRPKQQTPAQLKAYSGLRDELEGFSLPPMGPVIGYGGEGSVHQHLFDSTIALKVRRVP